MERSAMSGDGQNRGCRQEALVEVRHQLYNLPPFFVTIFFNFSANVGPGGTTLPTEDKEMVNMIKDNMLVREMTIH